MTAAGINLVSDWHALDSTFETVLSSIDEMQCSLAEHQKEVLQAIETIKLTTKEKQEQFRRDCQNTINNIEASTTNKRSGGQQQQQAEEVGKPEMVTFNVGGSAFSTRVSSVLSHSLEQDTFFSILVGSDHFKPDNTNQDDGEVYFIDRDPALFGLLMQYLRTPFDQHIPAQVQELSGVTLSRLQQEVDFYQLKHFPFHKELKWTEFVGAEGQQISPHQVVFPHRLALALSEDLRKMAMVPIKWSIQLEVTRENGDGFGFGVGVRTPSMYVYMGPASGEIMKLCTAKGTVTDDISHLTELQNCTGYDGSTLVVPLVLQDDATTLHFEFTFDPSTSQLTITVCAASVTYTVGGLGLPPDQPVRPYIAGSHSGVVKGTIG
eukprot:TRINITY_DN64531_c0_g2_i1.p1 TRINITY_DN64531_c0_g2~~TRINITY_DN64531_c0_g2_i1.p1  ORF type:complete len:378 (-),score=48.05 TRINITY_DN64531_c0_g2_i1:12-1145(-)